MLHRPFATIVVAAAFLFCDAFGARAADQFDYVTPKGVHYAITADGLSEIHLGDRKLASGKWVFDNGEIMFKAGPGDVTGGDVTAKSIDIVSSTEAKVRHVQKDVTCNYAYRFTGEDLHVDALVENRHTSKSIELSQFHGLTIDMGKIPKLISDPCHGTYTQQQGVYLMHPGSRTRFGASYCITDNMGIGVSPANVPLTRTMFMWDWDWNPGKRETTVPRFLNYYVHATILPRGSRMLSFDLRAGFTDDWKYLCEPYKRYLHDSVGELPRNPVDHRVILSAYINHSVGKISPENPYGMHDGQRIDSEAGAERFADNWLPAMKAINAQGIIMWAPAGQEPRGVMYRPDFDILPPGVERGFAVLKRRFDEAGKKLGVCTRPGELVIRANWTDDRSVWLAPNEGSQLESMQQRFKNMCNRGCSLYYLDTFGIRLEDADIARAIRQTVGPGVQCYAEAANDSLLPFIGMYSEIHFDPKANAYSLAGMDFGTWDRYRWLYDDIACTVRLGDDELHKAPTGQAEIIDVAFQRHVTPLVFIATANVPDIQKRLHDAQEKYLDASGHWKK